jgi:hypothetical protein
MTKTDLFLLWPKGVDYPLFREKFQRKYFDKVFVILTYSLFPFLENFIREVMDAEFVIPDDLPGDWVNNAMRPALPLSTSEWICVMHQDFFFDNPEEAFEKINEAMKTTDLIGFNYPTRPNLIEPMFWLMKRSSFEKTSKDFTAYTEKGQDCFNQISADAIKLGMKIVTLDELDIKYFHYAGTTSNYVHGLEPDFQFHKPEQFKEYCVKSLLAKVTQHATVIDRLTQLKNIL